MKGRLKDVAKLSPEIRALRKLKTSDTWDKTKSRIRKLRRKARKDKRRWKDKLKGVVKKKRHHEERKPCLVLHRWSHDFIGKRVEDRILHEMVEEGLFGKIVVDSENGKMFRVVTEPEKVPDKLIPETSNKSLFFGMTLHPSLKHLREEKRQGRENQRKLRRHPRSPKVLPSYPATWTPWVSERKVDISMILETELQLKALKDMAAPENYWSRQRTIKDTLRMKNADGATKRFATLLGQKIFPLKHHTPMINFHWRTELKKALVCKKKQKASIRWSIRRIHVEEQRKLRERRITKWLHRLRGTGSPVVKPVDPKKRITWYSPKRKPCPPAYRA